MRVDCHDCVEVRLLHLASLLDLGKGVVLAINMWILAVYGESWDFFVLGRDVELTPSAVFIEEQRTGKGYGVGYSVVRSCLKWHHTCGTPKHVCVGMLILTLTIAKKGMQIADLSTIFLKIFHFQVH